MNVNRLRNYGQTLPIVAAFALAAFALTLHRFFEALRRA